MPKIVSSSVVSASDHANSTEESKSPLFVYYCLCAEFLLVIDADLDQLPRRQSDNAIIITNSKRTYKLAADPGECVILKRENGYEKQYRYHCPRCQLLVAYNLTPQRKAGPFTYIVDSALTKVQGNVPPNALRPVPE